jgi:hypothetical protein
MAVPIRKPRPKNTVSQPAGEKRRLVIRLSGPMAAILGLVLVVAVGWSFFMGFMVGRGQNPETRVEQMTGLMSKDAPAPQAKAAPQGVPAPEAGASAAGPDQAQVPGQAPTAAPAPNQKGQKTSQGQNAAVAEPAAQNQETAQAPAYPFAHPSGNGLAAWGIKPGQQGAQGAAQSANSSGSQAGNTPGAQVKAAPTKTGPQFDFVYQVAAFKTDEDADKLRTRLEGKGLKTRVQKNGKLVLVMVSIRGTEDDAFNLREDLRHMRLGVPILVSQKAVSAQPAKKGR